MRKTIALFVLAGGLLVLGLSRWLSISPPEPARSRPDHRARHLPTPAPRSAAPTAWALVVDRSGSTAAARLEAIRGAIAAATPRLGPQDHLALISFAGAPRVEVALQPASSAREVLGEALAGLRGGGGSDLHAALEAAEATLASAPRGARRRILLIGDGQANQGLTDPRHLRDRARALDAAGVALHALALGPDAELELLADLSAQTDGRALLAAGTSDIEGALLSLLDAEGPGHPRANLRRPRPALSSGAAAER